MPTQQPKAAIEAIEEPLLKAYAKAWSEILDLQQQIVADPTKWRRYRRLLELQRAVEDKMAELDAMTRQWTAQELVRPYALGAVAGATELAESAAAVWTLLPQEAISRIATDTLTELLKSTRYVRRTTKAMIRAVGRDEILTKLIRGDTAVQAGKRVQKILENRGIHAIRYKDGSRHGLAEYSQMLVRTKTAEAYNLGSLEAQEALGVTFWECFDGYACGLTSHQDPNKALGSVVDKETALKYPISHPNAIMEGSLVESVGGIRAVYRARWSGPVYQVRTAAGARMTVGPNHPVLTARGWLCASSLREGDHVLKRTSESKVPPPPADVDLDQMPTSVEDVFATLREVGTHTRVVPAADYLHGDGEFCQGEIDIVSVADDDLPFVLDTPAVQSFGEPVLMRAAVVLRHLRGLSTKALRFGRVLLPAASRMGSRSVGRVAGTWTDFDARLTQAFPDGRVGDTKLCAELLRCAPAEVLTDQVVEIRFLESWEGHAYDLETETGVYWCDGILVHNCRRAWGARPDITTKYAADSATATVTREQIAANLAADKQRLRAQEARRYRQRTLAAPKPVSRAAARRTAAGSSLAAAKRGDAKIPTSRRRSR